MKKFASFIFSSDSSAYKTISYFYHKCRVLITKFISIPFLLIPLKKKKIVVTNYYGKGYGDNAKYIVEEIIRQGLNYDIVWLLNNELIDKAVFPEQVRIEKYNSLKGLYELATAKIWIDNCRKFFYPLKRKSQYYIQTWHASMGLKKIEKDAQESLPASHVQLAKKDSKMCDLMIAGSEFRYNLYKKSFWYDGTILKSGTPRSDFFFQRHDNLKEKVSQQLNIPINKKIVMYAPTFRRTMDYEIFKIEHERILNELKEKFGGDWIFLNRLHPNVSNLAKEFKYDDSFYDASNYNDMQELLYIIDVLITDYSSTMFDMALQSKICFLYAPDFNAYFKNDRGAYFDYNKLPFPSAKTINELIYNIDQFKPDEYNNQVKLFHQKINIYEDGCASQRVVKEITKFSEK